MYCTILNYIALHCTVLQYTALYCTILHCTALYFIALCSTAQYYTKRFYTALHFCRSHCRWWHGPAPTMIEIYLSVLFLVMYTSIHCSCSSLHYASWSLILHYHCDGCRHGVFCGGDAAPPPPPPGNPPVEISLFTSPNSSQEYLHLSHHVLKVQMGDKKILIIVLYLQIKDTK